MSWDIKNLKNWKVGDHPPGAYSPGFGQRFSPVFRGENGSQTGVDASRSDPKSAPVMQPPDLSPADAAHALWRI